MHCPQVGLKLMQDDGKVFSCYTNMWDTIFYSELGRCSPLALAAFALMSSTQATAHAEDTTLRVLMHCQQINLRLAFMSAAVLPHNRLP